MRSTDEIPAEPGQLSWRAHPLRERMLAGVLASGAILLLGGGVALSFGPGEALLAVIILVLALHRFFFPSHFVIDEDGVSASYLLSRKRLAWDSVRRFLVDGRGAYLSTRSRQSWFDAYSGLTLLFGQHRDAVVDRLRSHVPEASSR